MRVRGWGENGINGFSYFIIYIFLMRGERREGKGGVRGLARKGEEGKYT